MDGLGALILVPTRELAMQVDFLKKIFLSFQDLCFFSSLKIYTETKKFAKAYNITCAVAFGGGSLYEQTLACQEGCEILVCTPVIK